ncbi:E2 family protein B [Amphibacillus marinus]|uniref:E2 family protein B n=1 Tax=Amphibacillus marinus TaxID=872970 RepID=A0A1H8TIQ2_9BACI|nr:ThiF family adenylyltransferase [Amphibacillus marinus]SEO90388.1 E2 family protein B [Amphibacillus marinus]
MAYSLQKLKHKLNEIDQDIIQSFVIREKVDLKDFMGCSEVADIEVIVNERKVKLAVGFPPEFPNELPKFYDKEDQFHLIPHKLWTGFICFTRSESLIIDVRYPASILLNCLLKVTKILEDGEKGLNKDDFTNEFEVYWQQKCLLDITFLAHIDTTNAKVRAMNLWFENIEEGPNIIISAEKNEDLDNTINNLFHVDVSKATKYRCIYIPLKKNTFLLPPHQSKEWDLNELKSIVLSNITSENRRNYNKIVTTPTKGVFPNLEFIIIGLPTPSGNVALFGYGITGNAFPLKSLKGKGNQRKQIHPFMLKPKDAKLFEMRIRRWHPNHLLNRTGGQPMLKNKHVMVVGVGSVGSEVAVRFAKAGVSNISLVDYDIMSLDNVHRHALGSDQVFISNEKGLLSNKMKVNGVKDEINRKYPFTKVEVFEKNFLSLINESFLNSLGIDMLIISIGSPNIEMLINAKMHKLTKKIPTIYTWVEPLGIGGHTLVTLNGHREGCYQCLFKPNEESPIFNRSAFAKPNQDFSKSITGCGSVFTPYNFLDSERSAILTVEAGVKVLMESMNGNPLLSWKGDNSTFVERGFESTMRYSFSNERLDETKYSYRDDSCTVCSNESRDSHQ